MPSRIAFSRPRSSYPRLQDENVTFAEVLKEAGYRTVAVLSHFYWKDKRNVLQGFDIVDNTGAKGVKDSNKDVAAPRIYKRFERHLAQLAGADAPWLLFVHYFEPHSTYMRHKGAHDFGKGWMDKYDSEIHYVDLWVGRTLGALDEAGVTDRTAVILMSDHGEGNGEHGHKWHGQHLYNEVLEVPLVARVPGVAPRQVAEPVSLLDLGPTLIDLAGGESPPDFEGRSLVPALLGDTLATVPVRAELLPYPQWKEHVEALVLGDWKILRNRTLNTWELYDLAADRREQDNLYRRRSDKAAALRSALQSRPTQRDPE